MLMEEQKAKEERMQVWIKREKKLVKRKLKRNKRKDAELRVGP